MLLIVGTPREAVFRIKCIMRSSPTPTILLERKSGQSYRKPGSPWRLAFGLPGGSPRIVGEWGNQSLFHDGGEQSHGTRRGSTSFHSPFGRCNRSSNQRAGSRVSRLTESYETWIGCLCGAAIASNEVAICGISWCTKDPPPAQPSFPSLSSSQARGTSHRLIQPSASVFSSLGLRHPFRNPGSDAATYRMETD